MTYVSKNLKIFSSFHTKNNENRNDSEEFAKLKFFDDETDLRAWGCNAWRRQQYILEKMTGRKYRPPQAARRIQKSSSNIPREAFESEIIPTKKEMPTRRMLNPLANTKEDVSKSEFIQAKSRKPSDEYSTMKVRSTPNFSSQDDINDSDAFSNKYMEPKNRSAHGTRQSSPNRRYNNDYYNSNMQLSDNHTSYFTPEGEEGDLVSIYYDDTANFPTLSGDQDFSTKVEIQQSDCSIQTIYINDNPKICRVCKKLKRDYD